jgi:uncharacterized membrane protein YbhN (UPF0104 family)
MLKRIIKALIALLLIAVLLYNVDWTSTTRVLAQVSWWPLGLILILMLWELAISAWRWQWALKIHGLSFSFGYLIDVIAKGYFINNFLPSAVGGDAYRVIKTMPPDGYRSRALSAVLVERLSGIVALLLLGAAGALWLFDAAPIARWYLGVCVAGGAGAVVVTFIAWRGWLKPLTNRVRHLAVFDALEHNVHRLMRGRTEWLYIAMLAVLFQTSSVCIVMALFAIIGHPMSFAACALMTAAAGVAAVLPISINGIGVMEGSLVGMAVALGVDYETAVIVALLRRMMMVTLSVICGGAFLLDRTPAERAPAA